MDKSNKSDDQIKTVNSRFKIRSHDFQENDENFYYSHYNGISVMVRESDGYVNVGKLCLDGGKDFYDFKRGKKFLMLKDHWNKMYNLNGLVLHYDIKGNRKSKGTYIHPDFTHFVSHWISVEYAFAVSKIMDEINTRAHLKGISAEQNFQEVLSHLQSENEELRKQLAEKTSVIEAQDELINIQADHISGQEEVIEAQTGFIGEQSTIIDIQKIDIFQNHNRSTKYNTNHLWVYQDPKNQSNFKITVNQSKKEKDFVIEKEIDGEIVYKRFFFKMVFPSSFKIQ